MCSANPQIACLRIRKRHGSNFSTIPKGTTRTRARRTPPETMEVSALTEMPTPTHRTNGARGGITYKFPFNRLLHLKVLSIHPDVLDHIQIHGTGMKIVKCFVGINKRTHGIGGWSARQLENTFNECILYTLELENNMKRNRVNDYSACCCFTT